MMGCCAVAAQEVTDTLFDPDSVFTLSEQDIERETIAANRLIAGIWQYDKPSVQAQGTSVLGKLGKPLAQSKIKGKLDKAFKRLKIKKRWDALCLTEDGHWIMTVAGQNLRGRYSYSPTRGTITLMWLTVSLTAQVRREGKYLHLCFDTAKLLTLMRIISGLSDNETLKALAFLSDNYHDVKVGFRLKQKKSN